MLPHNYPVRMACSCCQELSSLPVPNAHCVFGIQSHGSQALRETRDSSYQEIIPNPSALPSIMCTNGFSHTWPGSEPHCKGKDSHSTFTHWREHWNLIFWKVRLLISGCQCSRWNSYPETSEVLVSGAFWFIILILKWKGNKSFHYCQLLLCSLCSFCWALEPELHVLSIIAFS